MSLICRGEWFSKTVRSIDGIGHGGNVFIKASSLKIDGQASFNTTGVSSTTTNTGKAGDIQVESSGKIEILNSGTISASTGGTGYGGDITITTDSLKIDGTTNFHFNISTGIFSETSDSGKGGDISIGSKGLLEIVNGGAISSSNYGTGNAGSIDVKANELKINKQGAYFTTGIFSDSYGVIGNAGNILVEAANNLDMLNSVISNNTSGTGSAGNVNVKASTLTLNNSNISAKATATSTGQTGYVNVSATDKVVLTNKAKLSIENAGKAINPASTVPGILAVNAPQIVLNNGIITSATSGNVNAGEININATNSLTESNSSLISSATSGIGNAGNVTVTAPLIAMDNASITAKTTATGNASSVTVNASQSLTETNLSSINSSTSGVGSAGTVNVSAPVISLDNSNISAAASAGSSGQTGNVNVTAIQALNLTDNAKITLQNDATVANPADIAPKKITVTAPNITLTNSDITTEATGNIKASDIVINFSDKLMMDPSYILTTANTGDGGSIYINGGNLIYLKDSGFRTSVSGANSNGGNIYVNADFLIMDTGIIQANAIGGFGGDVNLTLQGLIPSYDSLILGGIGVNWQSFVPGFNVIQAASQTGVSGNLNITSPQFNISGITKALDAGSLVLPAINRNPCQNSAGNSLKRSGKGGLPINEEKDDFVPPASSLTTTITNTSTPTSATSQTTGGQPCAASSI